MSAEQKTDEQLCWEYVKYVTVTLENKLKELEQNPDCIFDRNYLDYKNKLKQIYEEKAKGVKIRSKCEWYKFGEKSSKFFLNLEK